MRVLIAGCVVAAGLHGAGLTLLRQDLQLTQALAVGGSIAVGDLFPRAFCSQPRLRLQISTTMEDSILPQLARSF
jgi:hypothetical protein